MSEVNKLLLQRKVISKCTTTGICLLLTSESNSTAYLRLLLLCEKKTRVLRSKLQFRLIRPAAIEYRTPKVEVGSGEVCECHSGDSRMQRKEKLDAFSLEQWSSTF